MSSTVNPASRILTRISDAELMRRWGAVRHVMRDRGIDSIVMQNTNDWLGGYVKWFTDLPANNGYPRTVVFHLDAPMSVVEMGPSNISRTFTADETLHRGVGEMLHTPSFPSDHRLDNTGHAALRICHCVKGGICECDIC